MYLWIMKYSDTEDHNWIYCRECMFYVCEVNIRPLLQHLNSFHYSFDDVCVQIVEMFRNTTQTGS